MTSMDSRFIWLVRIVLTLMCLVLSAAASGQHDAVVAMNAFFNAGTQAMKAGDEAHAKEPARAQGDIASKVASAIGNQARAAFKDNERERAFALFGATLRLFEHLDDKHRLATSSHDLGVYFQSAGECLREAP